MALRVLGAGFGRTGTNSLRLALAQLGFGPCHHMFEVRDKPELLAPWQAAARGEALDWDKPSGVTDRRWTGPGRGTGANWRHITRMPK